ncbi:MAG: peptidylprolyl isomerase [bacterium]
MENRNTNTNVAIAVALVAVLVGYLTLAPYKGRTVPTPSVLNTDSYSTTTPITQTNQTNTNVTTNTMPTSAKTVTIETNKGTIVFEMFPADAPKTTENFATLAQKGFYDGVIFHRVIDGFMIQGGDPTGTGMGGPGYTFEDELNPNTPSYKLGYQKGMVAMANAGPNTNGSQFFIMLKDTPLPHAYTIFGRVISGQNVVDAIGKVQVGSNDKPVEAVVMKKVTVK